MILPSRSRAKHALFAALCCLTLYYATPGAMAAPEEIVFGVVPQQAASRLARLWTPLLERLALDTGLRITFSTAPDIPEFERRLAAGEYDVGYMNPYHYTAFSQHPGYRAFAREKDKKLKGIIVVQADSPVRDLADLANEPVAFPSPAAFAASVVTRAEFERRGIPIEASYVSSHDSVYRTVERGIFAAGGGVIRTFENMAPEIRDRLRILWTSPGYTPHAFAAHPRVPAESVARLLAAMEALEESAPDLLATLNFKGIEAADDGDWDDVRRLDIDLLDDFLKKTPETR